MSKIHGRNGQIHIGGTQWLRAAGYEIDVSRDFADLSVLGDTGKVFAGGLRMVTCSFNGLYDTTGNLPLTAAYLDSVAIQIFGDTGVLIASGDGWVTAVVTGSTTDAVRIAGTIKGTGGWNVT